MSLPKIKLSPKRPNIKEKCNSSGKRAVAEATMYEYEWCDTAKIYLVSDRKYPVWGPEIPA